MAWDREQMAARAAQGDYLLFLDNDSLAHPRLLRYYEDALGYEDGIGVVGGPALHHPQESLLGAAIAQVLSSPFGFGPFRSRYVAEGLVRATTERELILCNLLVKRSLFLAEGGFHTELYPNEDNEFLNRVQNKTKIFFHPLAACYRRAPAGLQHRPRPRRSGDTLEVPHPEVIELEEPAKKLSRAFGDDNHVRFGDALQARRKVRRLANYAALLLLAR